MSKSGRHDAQYIAVSKPEGLAVFVTKPRVVLQSLNRTLQLLQTSKAHLKMKAGARLQAQAYYSSACMHIIYSYVVRVNHTCGRSHVFFHVSSSNEEILSFRANKSDVPPIL